MAQCTYNNADTGTIKVSPFYANYAKTRSLQNRFPVKKHNPHQNRQPRFATYKKSFNKNYSSYRTE